MVCIIVVSGTLRQQPVINDIVLIAEGLLDFQVMFSVM